MFETPYYALEVTISPKKVFYTEKSIALYSIAHTLCGVYG